MAINKINLDGTEYSVGGGKAKLVATGHYAQSPYQGSRAFELDNEITLDKFYYVKFYDTYMGGTKGLFFGNVNTEFYLIEEENDEEVKVFCALQGKTFIFIPEGHYSLVEEQEDHIEVYELPITLGGNE